LVDKISFRPIGDHAKIPFLSTNRIGMK